MKIFLVYRLKLGRMQEPKCGFNQYLFILNLIYSVLYNICIVLVEKTFSFSHFGLILNDNFDACKHMSVDISF